MKDIDVCTKKIKINTSNHFMIYPILSVLKGKIYKDVKRVPVSLYTKNPKNNKIHIHIKIGLENIIQKSLYTLKSV